ncbi:PepSY-associated TM helix domain-containing protein [Mucilaginibacter gynuensis]|uniref:PepSY-associated TM helix domain-containing protein n=1 Tax=Mucilaginibacter gynuensis TaxID=1302236 RepID=A0ABP8GH70_9SPHI
MTAKKIFGKIHLWFGLGSGLVVFILGITGCILAFEYELKDLIYKDRYYTEAAAQKRLPLQTLLDNARRVLGKEQIMSGITVYEAADRTVMVSSYEETKGGWNYFSAGSFYTVFLDPYTGHVKKVENSKMEFFRVVLMLHYDLLMEDIGKQIIGLATLIFIVLLITGLVLWWPKNKAAAKQRFAFKWKATTQWKRKNYDLHNILGFYSLILGLIIALTGLVWAYNWFDEGMQWVVNGGFSTPAEKQYLSDSTATKKAGLYDAILNDMRRSAPNEQYYLGMPEKASMAIYGYSQSESGTNGYKWTTFNYDQQTGKKLSMVLYNEKPSGEQLRNMNYYIHTGAIIGLAGKILAFIVSFICAGLPVSGFYIWWGRNKKTKKAGKISLKKA